MNSKDDDKRKKKDKKEDKVKKNEEKKDVSNWRTKVELFGTDSSTDTNGSPTIPTQGRAKDKS